MADVTDLWTSRSPVAVLARAALLPAAALFRAATSLKSALYSTGLRRSHSLGAPVVSVGNLTVGGTGKTPVTNWLARELRTRGAKPAVLLRGYGDDETRVHKMLAPEVPVVANPDRVAGAAKAVAGGADVLILDDGFQHRRARRDADVVLVSADAFTSPRWPLPAGPWREPLAAIARAHLVLVTRKAASQDDARVVTEEIAAAAPTVPIGVVALEPDAFVEWGTNVRNSLDAIAHARVFAISAIGDPDAFEAQLARLGATVDHARFRDHFDFDARTLAQLAARATGSLATICTLKDAVKIGPFWPRSAPPLWYVSQRLTIEHGASSVEGLLAAVLAARSPKSTHQG